VDRATALVPRRLDLGVAGYFSLVVFVLIALVVWFYLSPSAEIPLMGELSTGTHRWVEVAR
jgi:hypothetical protein